MRLRPLLAYLLPDLQTPQRLDDAPAKDERDQERRHRGVGRPERHVLEDVQRLDEIGLAAPAGRERLEEPFVEDVVDHLFRSDERRATNRRRFIVHHSPLITHHFLSYRSFRASTTFSVCTPREPLTRTRSPGRTNPARASAASSESSKNRVAAPPIPDARAPSTSSRARPRTPQSTSTPNPAMSRPASRWSAAPSSPSSSISPATTTRRVTPSPPCATASAMLRSERGFELYESSTTTNPSRKRKTSPRFSEGAAVASASAISSTPTPKLRAAPAAANAFRTL